jgi:hypothetical protein
MEQKVSKSGAKMIKKNVSGAREGKERTWFTNWNRVKLGCLFKKDSHWKAPRIREQSA